MPRCSSNDAPFAAAADGVRLAVRLTPHARADRLDGVARLADDALVLKVSVAAPAENGRANEALLQLLAREWGLPRRDLALLRGHRSRNKLLHISGAPAALHRRLAAALAALPRS